MRPAMEAEDLVIVGAGWFGLVMGRTYLALNPSHNVVIVDARSSIGGVWSKEKLYPTLKTNNMLGTFEWGEFPMKTETYGVKPGEHIPGEVVHEYLSSYAEKFDLIRRIRLDSKVETVERNENDNIWTLTIGGTNSVPPYTVATKRLVVATGLASTPNIPKLEGAESFGRQMFHFGDFAKHFSTTKTTKRVAILGGAKSAFDAAYSYATAGVQVELIVRKSGNGPVWMSPPYVTPLKRWLEKLVSTRCLTWFSPCLWGDADGYGRVRRWLHSSSVGRWLVDQFWWVLGNDVLTLNGYDKHDEVGKLKPWSAAFWGGSMLGILNYPTDFFDLVKSGLIRVHIAEVEKLSPGTVHLSTKEELEVDLLCCATGWKHVSSIEFLPAGIDRELGLPHFDPEPEELAVKADEEIFSRFPRLKDQPAIRRNAHPSFEDKGSVVTLNRSFNLFRFIVPPSFMSKRNIGFCGMLTTLSAPMVSQVQALWLTVYFAGGINGLKSLSREEVDWQTVLENRYPRWRHPTGFGARYPDFVFDTIPYIDLLLNDLKLENHRKNSGLSEIFASYAPEDYTGLIEEWQAIHMNGSACLCPN